MKKIETKHGSALVFSLIVLFIGVVAALGIASTTIISKRMSGETGKSTQAFQTSESGAEIMLQKIKNAGDTDKISSLGDVCDSETIEGNVGIGGSKYDVTFSDEGGNTLECTDDVSKIFRINSVGSNAGTARAVNVAAKTCFKMDDNVVGYWKLNEPNGAGSYLLDSTLNNNDGNPNGTLITADSIEGSARSFNGASDYINVGNFNNSLRYTGNGTIEAWVKLDSSWDSVVTGVGAAKDRGMIFTKQSDNVGDAEWGFRLFVDNGRYPGLEVTHDIAGVAHSHYYIGDTTLNKGEWYYIVGVWDSPNPYLYVNGSLQTPGPTGTPFDLAGGSLRIGNDQPSFIGGSRDNACGNIYCRFFDGIIDEVRVSKIARDANFVLKNYQCNN